MKGRKWEGNSGKRKMEREMINEKLKIENGKWKIALTQLESELKETSFFI